MHIIPLSTLSSVIWYINLFSTLADGFSILSSPLWSRIRLGKRGNVRTLQAVSIGPSQYFEGADGPWQVVKQPLEHSHVLTVRLSRSSFPLQVGSGNVGGRQDVRVLPSTAGTGIWTIGSLGCPALYPADCADSRGALFLVNESLTWLPNSVYDVGIELNLGMDVSSPVGFDVATLGWQGSHTITIDHSVIWNLATSMYWLGTFGLNPRPMNFSTFVDPQTTFMQSALDRDAIPSLTYGYTAGNQYRLNSVFGSLTLGGYDSNRFIANNVTFNFFEDISRDLLVNLHSITADKTSPSNLLPMGSIPILIDSTMAELWLPESACSAFEAAFGIEWNSLYSRYLVTTAQRQRLLTQDTSVTFTLGPSPTGGDSVDITLPYRAFDLQVTFPIVMHPNTSYYFPLRRADNVTQYTLGRTFLQEAYLIADYQRQNFSISQCDWNQEKLQTENIVTILPPKAPAAETADDHALPTATIIGVCVGASGVLTISAALLFCFSRRRKKREAQRQADLAAKDAEAAATSTRPKISCPIGGELGGNDLHEMPEWKPRTAELAMPGHGNPGRHGYSEVAGAYCYAPGKYVDACVAEMDAPAPLFELPGCDIRERVVEERRPPPLPK